ncbi:cytosolic Fe-S cluster assembly factor cfd1 [Didymella heteroderae]|uniref:Cytosolic Fe-S cluster assembly factor cfd1 n=1 Tax=Didymella heteroderae TaxID=1769908 RepID=A0A9P5C5F6_9PLEO|nr:cytosolic Fe-S cluster assembly factor cfd1 [Didymella heteroderae]
MAFVANSLRQFLSRGQPSDSSVPSSVARFDGMSESDSEQMHHPSSVKQVKNDATITDHGAGPCSAMQYQIPGRDHAYQPTVPHHCGQSGPQFAAQQNEERFDHTRDIRQTSKELDCGSYEQYDEWRWQMPSRTASAQSHETPQYHVRINDQPHAGQLPGAASNSGAEVRVKPESAVHEHDDQDMFAEFTNEELHDCDARASAETQKVSQSINHTASDPPLIKQVPKSEGQSLAEAVERAEIVESIVTPAMVMQQTQKVSSSNEPQITFENVATPFRVDSEPEHPQSQVSSTLAPLTDGVRKQYYFGQYPQASQHSFLDTELQRSNDRISRSPSVDSVIETRRQSSEETASSSGGMYLSAKSQLAQQWQGRQRLFGNGDLTADAVHGNPVLLHGSSPVQEQSCLQGATATHPPYNLSSFRVQPTDSMQRHSAFPYNSNPKHPPDPIATQHDQTRPPWMTSSWAFGSAASQARPSGRSIIQAPLPQSLLSLTHIAHVQETVSEVSDDDEPLATRAPRHRSTTASPLTASAHLSSNTISRSETVTAMPKSNVPNPKQDSVIDSSGDHDEDITKAISWKLPDFEVTYHPATTDKNMPMAKVSILGQKENLVRSEVALTEDHAHHEMELFLNVFLPTQQALQIPDPEPAHAVINFHTIAVMVLEAFVQYEIGDEMGRGYGFHGGNVGNQVLRPSPSSDDEPTRTRSAKDADVDEIFFAVIDRWRAGLISGKGTLKLIRGCQEFCDIALDVIHYVKEHGLLQPEPKKRKERSDKGVKRGPQGGVKDAAAKGKATGKRKADAAEGKAPVKKGKVNDLTGRKKAKVEVKKTKQKPKPKPKSPGVTIIKK